jgi:hypothetical protein
MRHRRDLAAALAFVVVGALCAGSATAKELYTGEKFTAVLDSTFTVGANFRVDDRDRDLTFLGNDPKKRLAGSTKGFFTNADDGNLNYDRGDVYSTVIKGTFELEMGYDYGGEYLKDFGGFFRASAFYDFFGNCKDCTKRTDLAKDARVRSSVIDGGVVGAQWIFLDMYVDGRFELLERLLDLRVGNQVLNWGESIFTPGGINTTSAFDVTKLRIPGSELKEALVPAPIVRLGGDIGWGLSFEGYYQFDWNRTNVDPTGSYWATSDLVGRAAQGLFFGNDPGSGCTGFGTPDPGCLTAPSGIPQVDDVLPSDQGQFGVALRYFADPILSEFGLYYIRYHSKTPAVGNHAINLSLDPFDPDPVPTDYFREYGDKIDVVGASFTTEVLSATLAGEISYRWDDTTTVVATGSAIAAATVAPAFTPVRAGGSVREKRLQAVLNMIQIFGPSTRWGVGRVVDFLRADSFSLTSEIGVVHYPGLEDQCATPFQPVLDLMLPAPTDCIPYSGVGPSDTDELIFGSFPVKSDVDATSWGYQLFLRGEYTNPFGIPITVNPTVGWRHDFHGIAPNQTFIEDRMGVTVGLAFDYLQTWGLRVTYANFFGGKDKHLVKDRDFVSISASYAF